MRKTRGAIQQRIKQLSGLLTVWLWLLLPAGPTVAAPPAAIPEADRQADLSTVAAWSACNDGGLCRTVYQPEPAALVSNPTIYSFAAPSGWLLNAVLNLSGHSIIHQPEQPRRPGFFRIFLHSIFEHQIAINAP